MSVPGVADATEFREQLLGFNSKVQRLEQTRFFIGRPAALSLENAPGKIVAATRVIDKNGLPAIEIDIEAEVRDFTLHHFDRDDIEAAVLTYRMLTQNNDRLSVARLSNGYSSAHPWFQTTFESMRKQMRELLAGESQMTMVERPVSRQELLDTVIYGELAHSNEKKSLTFKSWTQWPGHEKAMWMAFDHTLRNAVELLRHFRDINAMALMVHFAVPLTSEEIFNRLQEKGIVDSSAVFSMPD